MGKVVLQYVIVNKSFIALKHFLLPLLAGCNEITIELLGDSILTLY